MGPRQLIERYRLDLLAVAGVILLSACTIQAADWVFPIPRYWGYWMAPTMAGALLVLGFGRHTRNGSTGVFFVSLVPLLLLGVWIVFLEAFDGFDFSAVLFHLQFGVSTPGLLRHAAEFLVYPVVVAIGLVLGFGLVAKRNQAFDRFNRWAALPILVLNPVIHNIVGYAVGAGYPAERLAQLYVEPKIEERPDRRLNLIRIYLESSERTYDNEQVFGKVYDRLAPLFDQSLSVRGIRQVSLTGWTTAGVVASECGTPLFSAGIVAENRIGRLSSVLPGARCLGQLLRDDGYRLAYFIGQSADFGGLGTFMREREYEVYDIYRLSRDPADHSREWGLADGDLLKAAGDHIAGVNQGTAPYAVEIHLIGGHAPDGVMDPACTEEPYVGNLGSGLLEAVRCMTDQAADFIADLRRQGLLDKALVVVQSDHFVMANSLSDELGAMQRENLFLVFGPGIEPREIRREAAMFDVLPTVLELLGYELQDDRAGLGVSLLSPQPTLIEQVGLEQVDDWIESEGVLAARLWGRTDATTNVAGVSRTN